MSKAIRIVEVGLRDGLQNESKVIGTNEKLELAVQLSAAGLKHIEIGAFVSAKWVPQMADSKQLTLATLEWQKRGHIPKGVEFSALVPNETGMTTALETGVKEIAIFAACSESFSQKNINCSIEESFQRFEPVVKLAKKNKIKIRGYLSTVFGCPYEGVVPEARVIKIVDRMMKMGVYEISIGDTIGIANPDQVQKLFKKLLKKYPARKFSGHFHDTRGTALANILAAYQVGVKSFDSSIGGLGGCPYAVGATGNVATEDVVYLFESMGIKTGVSLVKLIEINKSVTALMGKDLSSKVSRAGGFLTPKGKVSATSDE